MSEHAVSRRSLVNMLITTIVALIVFVFISTHLKTNLEQQVVVLEKTVKEQGQCIKDYKSEHYDFSEDCEIEINSLLRSHIEIYIKKRYTKTPKVIAKAISKDIIRFSNQYRLPPELVLGIIEVESMFNPRLESSAGAKGLMQVMPEWAPKLGLKSVNDLHEVDIGIESGIRVFLIHLKEAKGNISNGLYRYVNKNRQYVEKVYSSVGRFVTYRTTLENPGRNIVKEKNDKTVK